MQPSKEQSTPSREQIENALLLVVDRSWWGNEAYMRGFIGNWQPWADTEVGRSDALVLLAAVMKWWNDHTVLPGAINKLVRELEDHISWGNVQQIQYATFAAAAAIGANFPEGKATKGGG